MKKIIYLGIILFVFLFACRRPEQFPIIPEIKLISFEKYQVTDTTIGAILIFYFQDGDGDIGLNNTDNRPPFDTASIYYYNFFCDYYEKRNGIFEIIDFVETPSGIMPFNFNARIPRLSYLPEESISGEIAIKMPFYFFDPTSPYDTSKIKFYIVDRKLHHSNIEEAIMIRK